MRLLPAIIIAAAILSATVLWLVASYLFVGDIPEGGAVDSQARIDLEMMRGQLDDMQIKVDALDTRIAGIGTGPVLTEEQMDSGGFFDSEAPLPSDGVNSIIDAYAQVVEIAGRRNSNPGFTTVTPTFIEQTLGRPRAVLTDNCEAMTDPALSAKLVTEDVGPIRVQMLQPAIESLKVVFEKVKNADPDLYARISTAGSLCVRRIRGSQDRVSSHAFGTAVDLNIDGQLDTLGDGRTQLGLTILADFFKDEGWIWGAGFGREDSMHFEVSKEMIQQWRLEGKI